MILICSPHFPPNAVFLSIYTSFHLLFASYPQEKMVVSSVSQKLMLLHGKKTLLFCPHAYKTSLSPAVSSSCLQSTFSNLYLYLSSPPSQGFFSLIITFHFFRSNLFLILRCVLPVHNINSHLMY